jgi:hypothetical protein
MGGMAKGEVPGRNSTGGSFDAIKDNNNEDGKTADFSDFTKELWTAPIMAISVTDRSVVPTGDAGVAASKSADVTSSRAEIVPIRLSSLPEQKQLELLKTLQVQGYIEQFGPTLAKNGPEIGPLMKKFDEERGKLASDKAEMSFERLPVFGNATKELYSGVVKQLSKTSVPEALSLLWDLQLEPPVGLDIRVKKAPENMPASYEALLQALQHHDGELPIDTHNLGDVNKLEKVFDWLKDGQKLRGEVLIDRTEKSVFDIVEAGIKDGRYPVGWRRGENTDKEAWSSAVIQAIEYYNRIGTVFRSIDHLNHANAGFLSDGLKKLPAGICIETNPDTGCFDRVKFGEHFVENLILSGDSNQKKFQPLDSWLSSYKNVAEKAINDFHGDPLHMAGFGDATVPFGWVNPKTGEYTSAEHGPNDDWQKFNLIKIDTKVESKYDSAGELKSLVVTPNVRFADVPAIGYLNKIYTEIFKPDQKSTEYKPDDLLVVQKGPSAASRELIKAKELPGWLAFQQAKQVAHDGVSLAMDVGIIVDGGLGVLARRGLGKVGVEEAIAAVLKKEAPAEVSALTSQILRGQAAGSYFKLGIGSAALLQGNGENHTLDAISDLRQKYFFSMGVMPILNNPLFRSGAELAKVSMPEIWSGVANASKKVLGSNEVGRYIKLAQTGGLAKTMSAAENVLGMGVMPIVNNPLIRSGSELAKVSMPQVWAGVANISNKLLGSSEVGQYVKLAQSGKLLETIAAAEKTEKSVHGALATAEWGFIAESAMDLPGMLKGADGRERAFKAAKVSMGRANDGALDRSTLQKLAAFGSSDSDAMQFQAHFDDYKTTLGPMPEASAQAVEQIIKRTCQLAQPAASETSRQEFLSQLVAQFRYSGEQTKKIWEMNDGQVSEEELARAAREDSKFCNPAVQKVAAFAALALSKKSDGTWPEIAAGRQITVPEYSVYTTVQDPVLRVRPSCRIEQSITSAELMNIVRSDLHQAEVPETKEKKAAALYYLGLVSGEHYGSLLLNNLANSSKQPAADTSRLMVELGRVISRVSAEEQVRKGVLSPEQLYISRGLTYGLTSADQKKQLAEIADKMTDADGKATANFVLRFLNKQHIDQEDNDRFNKARNNPAQFTTADSDHQVLISDLRRNPTSESEWERKAQAVEYLAKFAVANNNETLKGDIMAAYKGCLEGPHPALAIRGLANFVRATAANKSEGLAAPTLQSGLVNLSVRALNNQIADDPKSSIAVRAKAAVQRVDLINTLMQLPAAEKSPMLKASLLAILDTTRQPDPFEEVRAAAVKGLAVAGTTADVPLLIDAAASDTSSSPIVRMQAIDTLERLNLPSTQLRALMKDLASSERDLAISLRLAKYVDAQGSVTDINSAASQKALVDTIKEQNRKTFTFNEVEGAIDRRLKKNTSVFDYLDASAEPVRIMSGNSNLLGLWNRSRETMAARTFWGGEDSRRQAAREELVYLEAVAQERAFLRYGQHIDEIVKTAMSGSPTEKTLVGDQSVDAREKAILTLGNLVSGGTRMGEPFYQHRSNLDASAANPGHQDFATDQMKIRVTLNEETARSNNVLPARDWRGKNQNIRMFNRDPWPEMEAKIAQALVDLAPKAPAQLPALTDQLLKGLGKESSATDESRKILVSGLSRVMERPELDDESRRNILRAVTALIGKDGLSAQNKSNSVIAMLDLVDRFAPRAFDRQSEDFANLRVSVESRLSSLSYNTTPEVRTRAHQLFNRLWNGVLDQYDGTAPAMGAASQKAELLPANTEALRAVRRNVVASTVIDDAVQRIFLSTKNDKITPADPRTAQLQALASEEVNDRVRLAANIALLETGADAEFASAQLLRIALNTGNAAHRADALAALERHVEAVSIPQDALSDLRDGVVKAATAYGVNAGNLSKSSNQDLIRQANQLLQVPATRQPSNAERFELQKAMHKFGSSLLTVGTLQAKKAGVSPNVSCLNFRDGFDALGLTAELKQMQESVIKAGHDKSRAQKSLLAVARNIMIRESVRGDLPHLIHSMNSYAELTSANNGEMATRVSNSTALLSLSSMLSTQYLPGGAERAHSLAQIDRGYAVIRSAAQRR